jgi:hypothetical protein
MVTTAATPIIIPKSVSKVLNQFILRAVNAIDRAEKSEILGKGLIAGTDLGS